MDDETMTWTDGTHTVTILETQALKLWAQMMVEDMEAEGEKAKYTIGFLTGLSIESHQGVAALLMQAKRKAMTRGARPMSAAPMH